MTDNPAEKPCLVETSQGFSVFYRNRYLYSRRNPPAAAQKTLASLCIQPGTLVLCISPLLCYGLKQFLTSLPQHCAVLCLEADKELYKLFIQTKNKLQLSDERFYFLAPEHLLQLPHLLNGIVKDSAEKEFQPLYTFRRAVWAELSAGAQFYQNEYSQLIRAADREIARFWRNRITLVQLGRLFAHNLFRNTSRIPNTKPFVHHSISKPIIVAGAGPSLDRAVNLLQTCRRDNFYLLAVDAAALPLVSRGIVPDSIVAVESQYAITPAYYSLYGSGIPLIADLTSRPAVLRLTGGDITFFASQYCAESFFTRFEKLLHGTVPVVPPLGSVGLTAVYISLLLRSNTSVPVFICGLDFSYGTALTHSRGSSMHTNLLANSYRLQPEEQIVQRAFSGGSIAAQTKNRGTVYTTPALAGYAQLFREQFAHIPNLLDIGSCGLDLGIRQYTVSALPNFINSIQDISPQPENTNGITIDRSAIIQFFRTEQKCLERIRDIITDGAPLQELKELLAGREYLYLHFPDGYRLSLDTAFLRRIRAELGYFIKDCRFALQQL